MKHLPNLLTIANLFCGCLAIAYVLDAQPFLSVNANGPYWVYGIQQAYLGSLFIFIAAVCDMLDGLAARALHLHSPLGKHLDSLADIVSFGVAPSMILYKLLWDAEMGNPQALDVSMLTKAPAFLIACFAALRLARFNLSETSKSFTGLPTPAVGLFIASLPLINWYNPLHIASYLQHTTTLYIIIALVCWLMVSRIQFFKLMPFRWPHIALAVITLAAAPFLKIAAIPLAFILYIILSLVYKTPGNTAEPATT